MVGLADRVRCRISGFEGLCIGRAEYLYGCVQVLVAPEITAEGKLIDSCWLDEDRVEVVDVGVATRPESAAVRAGGPVQKTPPSGGRRT
jgi:hypothetical protein